jgi:hypothetical protein
MSKIAGNAADVFICTGTGTGFTAEACTVVSGTTFQINDTTKRIWDKTAATTVYDGGVAVAESDYEICWASGKIILKAAPGGAVTVTGKHLTASQFGQAFKWSLNMGPNLADGATFGDTWEVKAKTTLKGTVSLSRFYPESYFLTDDPTDIVNNPFVLVLYEHEGNNDRYVCIGRLDGNTIDVDRAALETETTSFAVDGWIDYQTT